MLFPTHTDRHMHASCKLNYVPFFCRCSTMARGGRGGRRGGGQARPSKPVKKGSKKPVQKDDDMMYDEVDRYHNAKQSLSMNVEDDAADSADDSALDDEAAVFDVDAADESTSEEDDEALEEDIQRGGRTAQSACSSVCISPSPRSPP